MASMDADNLNVALTPLCDECRRVWLPLDTARWRAVFLENGDEDVLKFWCAWCWDQEFGAHS